MPASFTLGDLKTQVLDRADMDNSSFITDARLAEYINLETEELYDFLVNLYEDYFVSSDTITLVSGTEQYTLPTDYYKTIRVYFLDTGSPAKRWMLKRWEWQDLDFDDEYFHPLGTYNRYLRYRVVGNTMFFSPEPRAAGSVEHWYAPVPDRYANDADTVNFNIPALGWENAIIAGAAARCLIREESDPAYLLREKAETYNRLRNQATPRDAGEPARTVDIYDRFGATRSMRRGW